MAEVVGGPICLRICEDCPAKNNGQSLAVGQGKARVVVSKMAIDGVYSLSNGRSLGTFHESSTGLYLDDKEAFDLFTLCEGPERTSFFQKIGISEPDCLALENLMGGSPHSGDIVGHYAQKRG